MSKLQTMKIKVTFEKEFDSDEFYYGADPEDIKYLTFEQFKDGIYDYLDECNYIVEEFKFKEIKE